MKKHLCTHIDARTDVVEIGYFKQHKMFMSCLLATAATGGFGTSTGGLFGQPAQQQGGSLFKPFGQTTTAQSTGFTFSNTNTMGQANTNSIVSFPDQQLIGCDMNTLRT